MGIFATKSNGGLQANGSLINITRHWQMERLQILDILQFINNNKIDDREHVEQSVVKLFDNRL